MLKYLFAIFLIGILFFGCTRDDICDENTLTTPQLIILFRDVANQSNAKDVENLSVFTNDEDSTRVFGIATTDSIVIPLRTDRNLTEYRFIKNDTTATMNEDVVMLSYTTEDVYVNRACGFKTNFSEFGFSSEDGADGSWIINSERLETTIEDQTNAHLIIYH